MRVRGADRAQIMVQKNETRLAMQREWFLSGPFGDRPYGEHDLYVGETAMFLKNTYGSGVRGLPGRRSGQVMNGTIDRVTRCWDVDVETGKVKGLF